MTNKPLAPNDGPGYSVGGPTWFGSAPVPLSPLSQSWIQNTGSLSAARNSIEMQNPGALYGGMDVGGGYPVSRFPFTPKPMPAEARPYMKGVVRPWDKPLPSSRPASGGGGGSWMASYKHQGVNTSDGRIHGYSSKLQKPQKSDGLDWVESNGPWAKWNNQQSQPSPASNPFGSSWGTLNPDTGNYETDPVLKDDGMESPPLAAGQPFQSKRNDEVFVANDGTTAPINRGTYTAMKPGQVLTSAQQKKFEPVWLPPSDQFDFELKFPAPPQESEWRKAWKGLSKVAWTDDDEPPVGTAQASNRGNVPSIDDTVLQSMAQSGSLQTPTNYLSNSGIPTHYVPPPTPAPRPPTPAPVVPYNGPVELSQDINWLSPAPSLPGWDAPTPPVVKTSPVPASEQPKAAVAAPRAMNAWEMGAPADEKRARAWARDLWQTAMTTGDSAAKDLATKAVAWANLPAGQRQAILAQEERASRMADMRNTFQTLDPKLDPDAATNRSLWDALDNYNKTGRLPETVVQQGARRELRDAKGNLIGFAVDNGSKPTGGTVTDNGMKMTFSEFRDLHSPQTQKLIDQEIARRLSAKR